jgi:hypothetical protein
MSQSPEQPNPDSKIEQQAIDTLVKVVDLFTPLNDSDRIRIMRAAAICLDIPMRRLRNG